MTDLQDMPTRELCGTMHAYEAGRAGGQYPQISHHEQEIYHEAARRLSRYAPVRIDPEDESTWPTEEDAVIGMCSRPSVEIWYPKEALWFEVPFELVNPRGGLQPGYTHWRRIDNTPPQ